MEKQHYLALAFILLLVYLLPRYVARGTQSRLFGGPRALPVLGNLSVLQQLQKDPDNKLIELKEQWGDVCMLWFGSNPVLLVSSASAAKELLNERSSIYGNRPEQNEFRSEIWPFRLVAMPSSDEWRFLRKLYNNYLSAQKAPVFRKYQDHESLVMLADLLERPEDFSQSVHRYALSVMFSAAHGARIESLAHPLVEEFNDIWDREMKYFTPGTLLIDYLPVLQKLPRWLQPWHKRLAPLAHREYEMHRMFLATLKGAKDDGRAPKCFASMLAETEESGGLSEEMAVQSLAMVIGAGTDTTASVLTGIFKIIALNPDATRRAQEELDRVVGPNRLPTWEDWPNLPYLKCFIKEVHRVGLIGSLGIPHCAMEDSFYRGRLIPKGTILFPNLTTLSRDAEIYASPEIFEPRRFADDRNSSAASARLGDYTKRDHFHYGFGRRMCPGVFVAEASLYINISRILWAFDITPKPGAKLDMKDRKLYLVWKHNPYQVNIKLRRSDQQFVIHDALKGVNTGTLSFDDVMAYTKRSETG